MHRSGYSPSLSTSPPPPADVRDLNYLRVLTALFSGRVSSERPKIGKAKIASETAEIGSCPKIELRCQMSSVGDLSRVRFFDDLSVSGFVFPFINAYSSKLPGVTMYLSKCFDLHFRGGYADSQKGRHHS